MVMKFMLKEQVRFAFSISVFIAIFVLVTSFLDFELIGTRERDYWRQFRDFVNILVGNLPFKRYDSEVGYDSGFLLVVGTMFLFMIFGVTLLVSMMINRQRQVTQNIEALRRLSVLSKRNALQFDPLYGGLTMGFFPLNIFALPFYPAILLLKSSRLSDTALKLQYLVMILVYMVVALTIGLLVLPLLYAKVVLNALYIF